MKKKRGEEQRKKKSYLQLLSMRTEAQVSESSANDPVMEETFEFSAN